MKQLIILLFTMIISAAYGQVTTNKNFEKYAIKQDSLFIDAYNRHDVKTYNILLTDFLSKYNRLTATEKKIFSSALSNAYYNLCCTYALLDNNEMAITYLKKAIGAGYFNYTHLLEDKDLDEIRTLREFKTIIEPLRKNGDFLYILKKAGKYNPDDQRVLPAFSYQSMNNPNLVSLRKAFKLDSIAGTGNEISKIINLMHWIHDLIPHDGNHNNPVVKNAMSMIAECKRDHRGLNCRGLAISLNECYLAMGFKSRFVTCLPKDSLGIDTDCHVINMVYSDLLKKWIWMDPTFNAYVMNEKGELLGVEEVRERIIADRPLILNLDANWNRKSSQTKENYLYSYMAKNLYLLECSANNEYDLETKKPEKVTTYIQLLPLDYFNQTPDKIEIKGVTVSTTMVIYKTNNPALFWEKP